MIAADTSTWVAFLEAETGADVELLDNALNDRLVVMVPAVITGLLSGPKVPPVVAKLLSSVRALEIEEGYWRRAGESRAKVLRTQARLGDALIAQSCIDRGIPPLTRGRDFQSFADPAGLRFAT